MSYDLYMLAPEPGVDPMAQLERMESTEAPARDPEDEARMRRLADALRASDPRYEESAFEFEGTPGIELTAEDGMQITLMPDSASFNFPYWDSLDPGQLAADIDRASKIIAAETGWKLYDPQLEKFLDPVRDADEFAEAFGVGVGHVQRITSSDQPAGGERPSLWRRMFGRR